MQKSEDNSSGQEVQSPRDFVKSEIARLWNEPKSATEIGRAMGLTRGVVMGHIWRMRHAGVVLR